MMIVKMFLSLPLYRYGSWYPDGKSAKNWQGEFARQNRLTKKVSVWVAHWAEPHYWHLMKPEDTGVFVDRT